MTGSASLRRCVVLKHGEIFLKGRNRHRFEDLLHHNLRLALRGVPGGAWVRPGRGVSVIGGQAGTDELVARATRVMGLAAVMPAAAVPNALPDITAAAVTVLRDELAERGGTTFAVRARRRNKSFPVTSSELAAHLGAEIRAELPLTVQLTDPDLELHVEVSGRETYLSCRQLPGQGGLPVGASGRALVLLSGGYDSPVAAYRAMRRGLHCDFVHFSGAPLTGPASTYKAYALVRELNRYQPAGRLATVALGGAQKKLALAGAGRYQVIAQRRLMLRTAEALAAREGRQALVTGDSLGQVASQTLTNLATLDESVSLPILRPLLGFEKREIIAEAERIGTAEISVLSDEDCCQLLLPEYTATRAEPRHLTTIEARLGVDATVDGLVSAARWLTPDPERGTDTPTADPA